MDMYTVRNYPTKAALKRDLGAGKKVRVMSGMYDDGSYSGVAGIEGPHYPQNHTWYATATIKDGLVVSVK